MNMDKPVDLMKPWTIKSVPTQVINEINETAPQLKLTNGQLIEKMWTLWKSREQPPAPVRVIDHTAARLEQSLAGLVALLQAASSLPEHITLPGEVRVLINAYAREVRGLTLVKSSPEVAPEPPQKIVTDVMASTNSQPCA